MFKKIIVVSLYVLSQAAFAVSPYAGQEQRDIKALSESETKGLLEGKGMGMAKAGELNQYPGPKHVLELADKLELSKQQVKKTENLFSAMKKQAIPLGEKIVNKEQQLDRLFATRTISTDSLKKVLLEIGSLRAELRFVHLNAHLQQKAVLSEKQLKQYEHLRGYAGGGHHQGHGHGHH